MIVALPAVRVQGNGKYGWADVTIDKKAIFVSSPQVKLAVTVR
jgi:hypothetical protein